MLIFFGSEEIPAILSVDKIDINIDDKLNFNFHI